MSLAGRSGQGSPDLLLFERNKIAQVVLDLEDTINSKLIRILAISASDQENADCKADLRRSFQRISMMRYKASKAIPSSEWLIGLLYDGPYGGVESQNITAVINLLLVDGAERNEAPDAEIVSRFKAFYAAMTDKLAVGNPGYDLIDAL